MVRSRSPVRFWPSAPVRSAKVAQLVEHLTRNEKVGSSILPFGSKKFTNKIAAQNGAALSLWKSGHYCPNHHIGAFTGDPINLNESR